MDKDLIVPEVDVHYKYYYKDGVYYGSGFLVLSDFLDQQDYSITFNQGHIPILETSGKTFITEEHIEAYLLELHDRVSIHVDPVEPFHSKIEGLSSESVSINI